MTESRVARVIKASTMDNINITSSQMNFWIMNLCVSLMVFLSACYADVFIRGRGSKENKIKKNVIHVPDSVLSISTTKSAMDLDVKMSIASYGKKKYLTYFAYNIVYFLIMLYSVIVMKKYPLIMVGIQHIAIIFIISLYFLQFGRPTTAVPVAVAFTLFWFLSVYTSFRWIMNNTIVIMCILLTGYIQFRNFAYLQIFMWLAFVYDVYLLAGINFTGKGSELFSFKETNPTPVILNKELCPNLLCTLFTHNHNFELPTVFSIQLGHENTFVFLGTGDIIIGAFAANFTLLFFKDHRYLLITVFTFGTSVALLSQVRETPFPALLSIVPLCTIGLLLSALTSRRSVEMLLDTYTNPQDIYRKPKELSLV